MSLKTGTDRSRDDWEPTGALAGNKLNPWLLELMGARTLPLAPRSSLGVTMPFLASYIWQQSSRLAGRVTDYVIRLPLQMVRPPTLKPIIPSLVWQRLLDLVWFRRRKGQSELARIPNTSDEEEQLFSAANALHPMAIEKILSPTIATAELSDAIDGSFQPAYDTLVHPRIKQIANGPEIKSTADPIVAYTGRTKIPAILQTDEPQKPDYQQAKTQPDEPPRHTYQHRWLASVLTPTTQRSVRYRTPVTRSHNATHYDTPWAPAIPVWYRPYLIAGGEEAMPGRQAIQQPIPAYPGDVAEVTDLDDETPQSLDSYAWPVDLKMEANLPYPLPDQSKPPLFRTKPKRFEQPPILKTAGSSRKPPFNLPALSKEPVLSPLTTKATSQQTPEIYQIRRSIPIASLLPQIASQKVEAGYIPESTASMMHGPITVPAAMPDTFDLGQERPTTPAETPSILREHPHTFSLHRQLPLITESIGQTPTIPWQQYLEPIDNIPPPDVSEDYDFLWEEDSEPSSSQYKDSSQPALLELLLTSIAVPKTETKITDTARSLSTIFGETAYHKSKPVPELALAPLCQSEAAPSPPAKTETHIENTNGEATAPDIDKIARNVYQILKRRIARERERALGLS